MTISRRASMWELAAVLLVTANGVTDVAAQAPLVLEPTVTPAGQPLETTAPCATCDPAPVAHPYSKGHKPTVFPRPGVFPVPPSGPGQYSFLDFLNDTQREKPPAAPYGSFGLFAPSFFDSDFRYLENPENTQTDFFDCLKRIHPTDDTTFTFGGSHWVRYMNETNSRLSRNDNDYYLFRNRVFMDAWYQDSFRVYAEVLTAQITGETLPPLPIDRNRVDFLNLFAEVKVAEIAGTPAHVRVGRQELLYGSQRLVSTLDWANTRRTFDGVKAFWHSETLDLDAFWTRPVVIKPTDIDSYDHNQQFYGAWATWRPKKGVFADLYYLGLQNDNNLRNPLPSGRPQRGLIETHTFGARLAGNEGQVLYDFEGMLQIGTIAGKDHHAHAWTTAIGWEFKECPWRPQVWVSNDYASGTENPNGDSGTFQQLFPFGHYYMGFLDLVGRQNINDLNAQVLMYPTNWITVIGQYHHFTLAERRDFLYNAAGRTTRRSANGSAGRDVGDEFDLRVNFHLTPHSDVLFGYSKLFAGDFIRKTGANVDSELLYLMYNFRW